MKQLKRLIAVYEEKIVVDGHHFRVETSKDCMKKNIDDSVHELYDVEKNESLVASTILTYTGLYEIARAYLTGDKQKLEKAISTWCISY
jgi:hypothetical protein